MTEFDPYLRGYLLGRAAAKKHGPIDEATLAKLQKIADEARLIARSNAVQRGAHSSDGTS